MKKIYALLFVTVISFSFASAQLEGIWQVANQEASLAVGPAKGDYSWWSIPASDLTVRACFFDDEFVFEPDSTFKNQMGTDTWIEPWQGPEGCGAPVAPHDGSNAATWAYDDVAGIITLTGVGAHLGLPKVYNGGELSSPANAPGSITYPVVFNATMDTMTVEIEIQNGAYWKFILARTGSTSIEKLSKDIYTFYPNPASSEIQIETSELVDGITIRDITGKTVFTKSNPNLKETVNVSALPRGLYLVELTAGNKRATEKLILN